MLAIETRRDETLQIGPDISVKVKAIRRGNVRLEVTAPRSLHIDHLQADGQPRQRSAPPPAIPAPEEPTEPYTDLAALDCVDRHHDLRPAPGTLNEKLDALRRFTANGWVANCDKVLLLTPAGVRERNRLALTPLTLRVEPDVST